MKNKLMIITLAIGLMGCVDATNRQKHLQSIYPNCKVEPATGLIQRDGYDFIVIDTNNQIIAVCFYPFSETKIENLRNIR